jgi:hypothetical protein
MRRREMRGQADAAAQGELDRYARTARSLGTTCAVCDQLIVRGDRIVKLTTEWGHIGCVEAALAELGIVDGPVPPVHKRQPTKGDD